MCGIVGFTGSSNKADEILHAMLKPIHHRGPDETNIYINSDISFGHHRLIVVEPNGGNQPRVDTRTKNALVFNGELYGYKNQISKLNSSNIDLKDNSDTEVLFQFLNIYGIEKTLEKINGMFAFAYYDATERRVFLARDRFGEKPLYYGISNGTLVFGSELSTIKCHPLFKDSKLNINAISKYLHFDYIPNNETLFKNIYKLQPGNFLTWKNGEFSTRQYWKPECNTNSSLQNISENEYIQQLEDKLLTSVQQCLVADVPVALFLSGGIDSALIAGIAKHYNSEIYSYTVKFSDSTYDESNYAIKTASKLGINHEIIELDDIDLINGFDTVYKKLDEVISDTSLIPTYLVSRAVSKKATVALGGDGADELFAGYINFSVQKWSWLFSKLPISFSKSLMHLAKIMPASEKYMSYNFLLNQLAYGIGRLEEEQSFYWMAAFNPESQEQLWLPETIENKISFNINTEIEKFLDNQKNNSRDRTAKLILQFISSYLPDDILVKIDRASMYNSLEVRSPYLTREFAELALKIPSALKVKSGNRKYILKRLAEKYLPKNIVYRKKHGFALPVSELIKTQLKERFEDVLFNSKNPANELFNIAEVKRLWREHQENKFDHRKKIWSIFTLYKVLENYSTIK